MIRIFCLVASLIAVSLPAFSIEKYIGLTQEDLKSFGGENVVSGMWGNDFAVNMRTLNGERMVFLIEFSEKYEQQKDGKKRRPARTVDFLRIKLKSDEHLSDGASFRCREKETSVIGVFKKKLAKEEGYFSATHAWKIDENSKKFVPLSTTSDVVCDWFQNGDEEFPKNL